MKNKIFHSTVILCFFLSVFLFSCKATEIEKPVQEEIWNELSDFDQIKGIWISDSDIIIQSDFVLNDKHYFRVAFSNNDDTWKWENCARNHFTDLEKIWNKRFSYISEVYGMPLPVSDNRGCEYGVKLYIDDGTVISRFEYLIPMEIIREHPEFFMVSNKNSIKVEGFLDLDSSNRYIQNISFSGLTYNKFHDYWK